MLLRSPKDLKPIAERVGSEQAPRVAIRSQPGGIALRTDSGTAPAAIGTTTMPLLAGRFAVFDQWAEISSVREGRFLERIRPGAFSRTIREDRNAMRILFQHGQDPYIGDKPLASIEGLGEDSVGVFYLGRLFDTSYNRDLVPVLRAGQLGSSFRFAVTRESVDERPVRSAHNPERLPERTIEEARVSEFGPVTFPAYFGATAGVRTSTIVPTTVRRVASQPTRRVSVSPTSDGEWQRWLAKAASPKLTRDEFLRWLQAAQGRKATRG